MNRIDVILEKEQNNADRIFLYLLKDRFIAFDQSAYYTNLLCPQLKITWGATDTGKAFVCICIPDNSLRMLFHKYNTFADDECIQITPPFSICRQQSYFNDWKQQQFNIASKIHFE